MAAASKKHGTPNWADCATTSLAEAEAFYKAVFGWTSERTTASDGTVYSVQHLDGKRVAGLFELSEAMRDMKAPPHWSAYFEIDDVEAAMTAIKEAGGKLIDGPLEEPGVGTILIVQDSVGAFLRLWHSVEGQRAEVTHVPGAMNWNELCAKEPQQASRFYEKVLGLQAVFPPAANGYGLMVREDQEVAGILPATPQMGDMPASWDVYFASDDVDATVQAAITAGGKVLKEPFDVAGGQARLAVLEDPLGAVFEVMKVSAQAE